MDLSINGYTIKLIKNIQKENKNRKTNKTIKNKETGTIYSKIYNPPNTINKINVISKFLHSPIIEKIKEFLYICFKFKSKVTIDTGT